MNTATLNATVTNNAAPSLADAARTAVQAGAGLLRRIITTTAKNPAARPPEGTYEATIESIDVLDEMMKVPNSDDKMEPIALMSLIVTHNNQRYRLYYRNPISFLKRDLPRIRNYYEVGGIKAIGMDPNLLAKLSATVEVEYNGDQRQFTNVRFSGVQASSPTKKAKFADLAEKIMDEKNLVQTITPQIGTDGVVNVPTKTE